MVLSVQNILQYLYKSSSELISFDELFNDEVSITPNQSLNNTFIVKFKKKQNSLVIKQAFVVDNDRKKSIKNEYLFTQYYLKKYKKEETKLYPLDNNKLIFIREFIKNTEPINHFFKKNFDNEQQIGFFLGSLAKEFSDIHFKTIAHNKLGLKLNNTFPFPDPDLFNGSQPDDKFWKEIKKSNLIVTFVKQQHKEWGNNKYKGNLIHQDANLANILYRESDTQQNTFFLIDWEFCQTGDPLWDIAYFSLDIDLQLTKLESHHKFRLLFDKYFFVEYGLISEQDQLRLEKYQLLIKLKKLYFDMTNNTSIDWKDKQKAVIDAFEKL